MRFARLSRGRERATETEKMEGRGRLGRDTETGRTEKGRTEGQEGKWTDGEDGSERWTVGKRKEETGISVSFFLDHDEEVS